MNNLVARSVRLENVYDPSYRSASMQSGGALSLGDITRGIKKVNKFAKDNKVFTKLKGVTDVLGVTPQLDAMTSGLYSKGSRMASQAGYGQKMVKQKGKGKKSSKKGKGKK